MLATTGSRPNKYKKACTTDPDVTISLAISPKVGGTKRVSDADESIWRLSSIANSANTAKHVCAEWLASWHCPGGTARLHVHQHRAPTHASSRSVGNGARHLCADFRLAWNNRYRLYVSPVGPLFPPEFATASNISGIQITRTMTVISPSSYRHCRKRCLVRRGGRSSRGFTPRGFGE